MKRVLLFFVAALVAFCANAQKVKQYRYWFDDALNQAVTTVVTPVASYKLAAAINGPLSPGFHRFSIQFSDDSLRYSSVASQYFYKPLYTADTLVKKYECWYDDDYAHKTSVAVPATAALNFTLNGDETLLNAGLHKFSIRFGGDSIWSGIISKYFIKQLVNVDTLIKGYEYWYDADYAHKVNGTVATTAALSFTTSANAAPLNAGQHTFNIRFRGDSLWGSPLSKYFIKQNINADTLIKGYEYWYDADYAHKVSATVTSSSTFNFKANIDASSVGTGAHTFNIRFRGDSLWGSTASNYFLKIPSFHYDTAIKGFEYWFDTDYAHKVSGATTAAARLNFSATADAALLNAGQHIFNIRFKGDSLWGSPIAKYFVKQNVSVDTLIKGYEYWYDADYAHKVSGTVTSSSALNFKTNIDASTLGTGAHTFNIRFRGDSLWGCTASRYFSKIPASHFDTTVKAYEYWYDSDYVHKISGTATAAALLNFSANVSISLNTGPHSFNIRFKGDSLWSSPLTRYFSNPPVFYRDTAVKAYEYWYDGDYAHKVSGSVNASDTVNFKATIDETSLSTGLHSFNIRFKGDSLWSSPLTNYFSKAPVFYRDTAVKAYEYWYDGDYAHKVSGTVSASAAVNFKVTIDETSLSTGLHSFNIRFKGDSLWSSPLTNYFSKAPVFYRDTAVKAYEYWYDGDYAHKVSGTVSASAAVNFKATIDETSLSTGLHSFNIRFKGDSLWSSPLTNYFSKAPVFYRDTAVKAYEYWYDGDYAHKVSGTVGASAAVNFKATIDETSLSTGLHSFNIRFKGDSLWSSPLTNYFSRAPVFYHDTAVKAYEYWYDSDYTHKVSGTVSASAAVNFKATIDETLLSTGFHLFNIRFRGDSLWSSPLSQYFVKQPVNIDTLVKGYEYWYDDDYTHKVSETVSASAIVNFKANIDASSLGTGQHKFTIRLKGDSLWSSPLSQYFVKQPVNIDTLVKGYEYWYDDDYTHRVSGTVSASAIVNFKANIDESSLNTGLHSFNIRFKGDSLWSSPLTKYFSKAPVFYRDTVVKSYEYWYDGDYAHKVSGTVGASAAVNFKANIDESSLSTGLHSFNIRFKGDSLWSSPLTKYFSKAPVFYHDTVVKSYEYWFDGDYAHKVTGAVTASALSRFKTTADASSLKAGFHSINIRFRGDSLWSSSAMQYFYKIAGYTDTLITGYEYWFDDDYTNKIVNVISAGAVKNLTAAIDVSPLAEGMHRFNIRLRSDSATWSSTVSQFFAKASGNITGYEYWFDNNYASKVSQPVTAAANVNIAQAINTDSLAAGFHTFNIRAHGVLNSWSPPVSSSFIKIVPPGPGNVITGYRYWFDNSLSITKVDIAVPTPAAFVNITNKISTLKLDTGYHQIYIQARDTAGFWSAAIGYKILIVQAVLIDSVVSATTVCPAASFKVTAQPYGSFGASNIFTAQLSDTAGKFTSPITIGTLKASPSGNKQSISITVTMPFGITNSSKYRIRVISSSPALTSDSTSYAIAVQKPGLGADIAVKICPGTFVNLTKLYNTTGLTPFWKIPRPDSVTTQGADTLIVTNTYGCKDTAIVTVSSYAAPIIKNITIAGCNSVVYNGVTYSASAVKRDTVKSQQGCDSIYKVATITITKITPVTQTTNITGCGSVVYNGITYTASATRRDTIRSVQGCDSIYKVTVITITGNLPPPPLSTTGTVNLCANDSLVLTTTATGTFQWYRNGNAIKNATLNRYVVNIAGVYTLKVTNAPCTVVSATVNVNVTQVPKPIITLVNDTLISSASTGNQWYLNGRPLAGITSQRYSPLSLGYYAVTATVNGCVSPMSDQFIYTANTFTKTGAGNIHVKMYPNPATDEARLTITGASGLVVITITDMAGKTVWQSARMPADKTIILPVAKFASTAYVVTIRDRRQVVSLKLVKAN